MDTDFDEHPIFEIPQEKSKDVTSQAVVVSFFYPYHSTILGILTMVSMMLLVDPMLIDGIESGRFFSLFAFVLLWGVIAYYVVTFLLGERGLWYIKKWGLGHARRKGRPGRLDFARTTPLALCNDYLQWEQFSWKTWQSGTSNKTMRTPYSQITYAVIYGDVLFIFLNMSSLSLPEISVDISKLDNEAREDLSNFLEGQVNAARHTREYRKSITDNWKTNGGVVRTIYRWGLYALAIFFVFIGVAMIISLLSGGTEASSSMVGFTVLILFLGLWLIDAMRGKALSRFRKHPLRARFRVSHMSRRNPVNEELSIE